jgi:hypothetical protein
LSLSFASVVLVAPPNNFDVHGSNGCRLGLELDDDDEVATTTSPEFSQLKSINELHVAATAAKEEVITIFILTVATRTTLVFFFFSDNKNKL